MDKWQALFSFWSGFGVDAYEENSVPDRDDIAFPYITYESAMSGFDESATLSANIWTRSNSWEQADVLANAIYDRLKNGGFVTHYDGGILWIIPREPFAQSMGDPDDDKIKRKLLSVTVNFA